MSDNAILVEQYSSTVVDGLQTVLASVPITLTQDTADSTWTFVAQGNLVVYADEVTIRGLVTLNGYTVSIFARSISTENDTNNNVASIDVSGAKPPNQLGAAVAPDQASIGSPGYSHAFGSSAPGGIGTTGTQGATGVNGNTGANSGCVQIYTESFESSATLSLLANGGTGQQGQNGGQGGQGGDGGPGAHGGFTDCTDGGQAGQGGLGGAAGSGGAGGNGGVIAVLSLGTVPSTVTVIANAGAGGLPGTAGTPGAPGNPGIGGTQVGGNCGSGAVNSSGNSGLPGSPGASGSPGSVSISIPTSSSATDSNFLSTATCYRAFLADYTSFHCYSLNSIDTAGWDEEDGKIFNVWPCYVPDTVPVYLYSSGFRSYYSLLPADTNAGQLPLQGIAWWIYPSSAGAADLVQLQHYTDNADPTIHFYTADPTAEPLAGWTLAGTLGYVPSTTANVALTYDSLAPFTTPDQRNMLLWTAQVNYLAANPTCTSDTSYSTAGTLLAWLSQVTNWFNTNTSPVLTFSQNDVDALIAIYSQATGLFKQLLSNYNYFGQHPDYIPLGSLKFYTNQSKQLLNSLDTVEAAYNLYYSENATQQDLKTSLTDSINSAGAQVESIGDQLTSATATVNSLAVTLGNDSTAVNNQEVVLTAAIETATIELTAINSFDCTLKDLTETFKIFTGIGDGDSLKQVGQISQQLGTLAQTNIPNLYSSAATQFLIGKLDTITGELDSGVLKEAYVVNNGAVSSNPNDPNGYKLMVAQSELSAALGPYQNALQSAQDALNAMNLYVSLVQQMNTDILAYNAAIAQITSFTGQQSQCNLQIGQAGAQLGQIDPTLPALTAFMGNLYQQCKADCLTALFMANRAYAFWSLDTGLDVFYLLFNNNTPNTPLDPRYLTYSSLTGAQATLIASFGTAIETATKAPNTFPNTGSGIELEITDPAQLNPLLSLSTITAADGTQKQMYQMYIALPAPGPDTSIDESCFSGFYQVRVTKARPWIIGAITTSGTLHATLTHTGSETVADKSGTEYSFVHDPLTIPFIYNLETLAITEDADISSTTDTDYGSVGPFTLWWLTIDPSENDDGLVMSGVTGVTLEFWGTNYQFPVGMASKGLHR